MSWSGELLLRVERADAALIRLRVAAAPAAAAVQLRDFGGPVALATLDRPNTLFNRAVGLGPEDAKQIAPIVELYRELGVPPRIDVCPALRSDALDRALRAAGLEPGGFPFFSRRVLLGKVTAQEPAADVAGIAIERLGAAAADIDAFLAIQEAVWPVPESVHRRALAELRTVVGPSHRRYLARIAGQPVAMAAMDLHDGIAYLSNAATLEPYRGRGCQGALIRRRLADALAAGAQIVFSVTAPGSQSERNLCNAGLDFSYDRETWLPPDWTAHPFYRDAA